MEIPSDDRIENKNPPQDPADKKELNALRLMTILDKIVNGGYDGFRLPTWTMAARPGSPEIGTIGINTTAGHIEWWDGNSWQPLGV